MIVLEKREEKLSEKRKKDARSSSKGKERKGRERIEVGLIRQKVTG